MTWNSDKQRWECDRCSKPIRSTQIIQLCKECNDWLEKECSKKDDTAKKNQLTKLGTHIIGDHVMVCMNYLVGNSSLKEKNE